MRILSGNLQEQIHKILSDVDWVERDAPETATELIADLFDSSVVAVNDNNCVVGIYADYPDAEICASDIDTTYPTVFHDPTQE